MERKSKSLDPFPSTVTGDKKIWHGVNIGFVTYKQLIGELIGTMKYRCEITLKRKPVCISMMFFKFETYYRYQ